MSRDVKGYNFDDRIKTIKETSNTTYYGKI